MEEEATKLGEVKQAQGDPTLKGPDHGVPAGQALVLAKQGDRGKMRSPSPEPRTLGDQGKSPAQPAPNLPADLEFSKLRSRQKYSEYYHFVKLLGQGAFCSVYQAIDKAT